MNLFSYDTDVLKHRVHFLFIGEVKVKIESTSSDIMILQDYLYTAYPGSCTPVKVALLVSPGMSGM